MKDIILRGGALLAHVNALGAELKGVERDGLEYLWQGEESTYPRTSPTLFPVIGRFLSDTYYVGDKAYQMPLNGFALNSNFTVLEQTESSVAFGLSANDKTRKMYPFEFSLQVGYSLAGNCLTVRHAVENHGDAPMPFCVGIHTAYRWPRLAGETPEDYFLKFERRETLRSFNPFGWEDAFLEDSDEKPMTHALFTQFTRSLRHPQSQWLELASRKNAHAVRIHRGDYPYLAIWTMPDPEAAFVCLEPCTSVHPGNHPSLHLEDRDGARLLAPGARDERTICLEFR